MGWVTDWDSLRHDLIERVDIGEVDSIFKIISCWMDEDASPEVVVSVLRQVIWADLESPVVIGHHGEVLQGLPQLLKAYMEGCKSVPVVRLPFSSLTLQVH